MSDNNKHIKSYTAADIQRYLNREMTMSERHAMEKAALEDPFLAEAMEGYGQHRSPDLSSDIKSLKKRLQGKNDTKIIPLRNAKIWWSAAAAILIISGAAFTWYWLTPTGKNIAQQKEKEQKIERLKENRDTAGMPAAATDPKNITSQENKAFGEKATPASEPEKKASVQAPSASPKTKHAPSPLNPTKKDVPENAPQDMAAANKATSKIYRIEQEERGRDLDLRAQSREKPAPPITQNKVSGFFNTNIIRGKITDSNNNPLPFVNIRIDNTTFSTYSDARGNFKLISGDTLLTAHFKSAGFEPRQVVLHSGAPSNDIILTPEKKALAEVTVTGYETAKKGKAVADEARPEAEPEDGWGNYDIYLANNTRPPGTVSNAGRGFVELSFTVDEFGNLSDFKIAHSTCPQCNKEAIRVIKEGPKWKLSEGSIPAKVTLTIQF